jgi:hypothetical protein
MTMNMDDVLSVKYEYGTLKLVKVTTEEDWGRKENNGKNEPIGV